MYCYNCMNTIADGSTVCPVCKKVPTVIPVAHHLPPGTVLNNNKYTIGKVLGEGGFGITYVGLDNTLEIRVAIKEFFPSGYANRNHTESNNVITTGKQTDFFATGKERFLQEARSLAKFTGETGVVNIRDFFEANNTAYIVMEFLDGADLNNCIKRNGPFKAEEIFTRMMPVMYSLEKIHESGLIHRDISPENIMCLKNGTLKLMDFGSARHYLNQEKAFSVMLKQGYAPEEQYSKNGKQGPWTDVYGLCATIYKCITGVIPEDGLDRIHGDELKKPSELGVAIHPSLERLLMYGLAVFRENRCQNMRELLDLTQKALRGEQLVLRNDGTSGRDLVQKTMAADAVHRTMIAEDLSPSQYSHHENNVPSQVNQGYYHNTTPSVTNPPISASRQASSAPRKETEQKININPNQEVNRQVNINPVRNTGNPQSVQVSVTNKPIPSQRNVQAQTGNRPKTAQPHNVQVSVTHNPVTYRPSNSQSQGGNRPITAKPHNVQVSVTHNPVTGKPQSAQSQTSNRPQTARPQSAQSQTGNRPQTARPQSVQSQTGNKPKTAQPAPSYSAQTNHPAVSHTQNPPEKKKKKKKVRVFAFLLVLLILIGVVTFFAIPKSELGTWETEISLYQLAMGADAAGELDLTSSTKSLLRNHASDIMVRVQVTFYKKNEYDVVALNSSLEIAFSKFANKSDMHIDTDMLPLNKDANGNVILLEGDYLREGKYIYLDKANRDDRLTVSVKINTIEVKQDEAFGSMLKGKTLEIVE